ASLARRQTAEAASAAGSDALKAVRASVTGLSAELDKVVNTAHGSEIARAEHRLRLEQMEVHAVEEYGVEPSVLTAEDGPDILVRTAIATPERLSSDGEQPDPDPAGPATVAGGGQSGADSDGADPASGAGTPDTFPAPASPAAQDPSSAPAAMAAPPAPG